MFYRATPVTKDLGVFLFCFVFLSCFTSRWRISRSHGEGLQNVGLCPVHTTFVHRGIFIVLRLLSHGAGDFAVLLIDSRL